MVLCKVLPKRFHLNDHSVGFGGRLESQNFAACLCNNLLILEVKGLNLLYFTGENTTCSDQKKVNKDRVGYINAEDEIRYPTFMIRMIYIYIYIYIYTCICLWRKGINKLRFHPDKPVSWLPTHQGT